MMTPGPLCWSGSSPTHPSLSPFWMDTYPDARAHQIADWWGKKQLKRDADTTQQNHHHHHHHLHGARAGVVQWGVS